jgi:hypothetical protein
MQNTDHLKENGVAMGWDNWWQAWCRAIPDFIQHHSTPHYIILTF